MDKYRQTGLSFQNELIQNWLIALKKTEPASSLIETHISWVIMSGQYAYKIKKALCTDFLDYSDLTIRHFYCDEEIRLNRRTAPEIYLDVVPIGGRLKAPLLGTRPVLEYAVRMRQFDVHGQFDHLLKENQLTNSHIDGLAGVIAGFHQKLMLLPKTNESILFGSSGFVMEKMVENQRELGEMLVRDKDIRLWEDVKQLQISVFRMKRAHIDRREKAGFVHECHGDMHLGNLVAFNGKIVPFDGIEFDARYRWMDVMDDVAFAFMDLLYFGQKAFAWRLLNHYLAQTGDYDGVSLLRFYASCHATVRAKVHLMRQLQETDGNWHHIPDDAVYRRYLILANDLLKTQQAALVITMGLPGSGKTVFAKLGAEKLPGICLRSDVERQRLFPDIKNRYTEVSKQTVYDFLLETTGSLLQAGMTVIVDASFIRAAHRIRFLQLAQNQSVPFAIALIRADRETMEKRLTERQQRHDDASDAGTDELKKLTSQWEPLTPEEKPYSVEFVNKGSTGFDAVSPAWETLFDKLRTVANR